MKDGATPLFIARRNGHVGACVCCWNKARRSIRRTRTARTPLYAACQKGHVDVVRLLLDKGEDVNRARNDGQTPLFAACEKGHVDAARLLLERGAVLDHDSSALCEGDAVEVSIEAARNTTLGKSA